MNKTDASIISTAHLVVVAREYRKFLLVFIITLLTSGCAFWEHYLGQPNRLVGAWTLKGSRSPLVLKFDRRGNFIVDANADGRKDIWGRYELFGNRVKFTDDLPWLNTDCYEAGFYHYTVKNKELKFELFADHCKPRKHILSLSFVKHRKK